MGVLWSDLLVTHAGRSRVAGASDEGSGVAAKPRKATLSVRLLRHIGRKVSIVSLWLGTGRLHQIRVQARDSLCSRLPGFEHAAVALFLSRSPLCLRDAINKGRHH